MIMTISSTPLPCRPVRAVQTCGLVLLSAVWTTASKRPDTRGRLRLAVNVTASTTAETTKAAKRRPRAENVAGDFYVDHTCIDCDTCRWMDPGTFGRMGNMSVVVRQPGTPQAREDAMKALLSCPTFSIHAKQKMGEVKAVMQKMPMPVEGCSNVYHLGFASADSYGSTAYFIVRDEGNILVDSPRFHPQLSARLEELGGAKYHFLTHAHDVAGHAEWQKPSIQSVSFIGLNEVEHQLQGTGPWQLPDGSDDIQLIHVPGHTAGSIVLLYKPGKVLFTGDHVGIDYYGVSGQPNMLVTFGKFGENPKQQIQSINKLRDVDFLHLLPGHGRRQHFRDVLDREQQMDELVHHDQALCL